MQICAAVDRVYEAMSLLSCVADGFRPLESQHSIALRTGLPLDGDLRRLDMMETLLEKARNAFAGEMEEVRGYFRTLSDEKTCLAQVLLPSLEWGKYESVETLEENLGELDLETRQRELWTQLDGEEEETPNLAGTLRLLMEAQLNQQEKWDIQRMLLDFDQNAPKALALLKRSEAIFESQRTLWEPQISIWHAYWSERKEDAGLAGLIRDGLGLDLGQGCDELKVLPSVVRLNGVCIRFQPEEGRSLLRLGLLFGDQVRLERQPWNASQISQTLKLLADKSKLEILSLLKKRRFYSGELANALKLSNATVSYHMNALLTAGLIDVDKDEKRLYYSLNQRSVREVLAGLEELLL